MATLWALPKEIEVCGRVRDGFPCLGVLHRPLPEGPPVCYKCSSTSPGVIYERRDA